MYLDAMIPFSFADSLGVPPLRNLLRHLCVEESSLHIKHDLEPLALLAFQESPDAERVGDGEIDLGSAGHDKVELADVTIVSTGGILDHLGCDRVLAVVFLAGREAQTAAGGVAGV